jgi:hypothetical protein
MGRGAFKQLKKELRERALGGGSGNSRDGYSNNTVMGG